MILCVCLCAVLPVVWLKLDPWHTLGRVKVPSIWTTFDAWAPKHP